MLAEDQIRACAKYVVEQAKHVCETFADRDPGSLGESASQDYICEELAPYVDSEPQKEAFEVAPKAFMGFQRVTGTLVLIGLIAYWWVPIVSALASGLALLITIQVLLRYKLFLEPFCRKRTSYNVAAVRKPSGDIHRRIILGGHVDAVYEWRIHYRFPKLFPILAPYSLLAIPVLFVASLSCVAFNSGWDNGYGNIWGYLGVATLVFAPASLLLIFCTNFSVVVPGANDNLSGTFIAVGLAKWFSEARIRLENTEIVYLITGSEEAGLRGAKAYAKKHKSELLKTETVFVAIDTIRDLEHLKVYNKDLNGTLSHDPRVARLFKEAGKRRGLDLPYGSVTIGSTDATAFTQEGVPSVAMCAMDPAPAEFYHTRKDAPDIMNPECIGQVIAVVVEALTIYDKDGLAGFA